MVHILSQGMTKIWSENNNIKRGVYVCVGMCVCMLSEMNMNMKDLR